MKDYTKKKPQKTTLIAARVPLELKAKLEKLNLNISAICRDALEEAVKGLEKKS